MATSTTKGRPEDKALTARALLLKRQFAEARVEAAKTREPRATKHLVIQAST